MKLEILWNSAEKPPEKDCYCLVVWEYEEVTTIGEAHYRDAANEYARWLFPFYGDSKDTIEVYPTVLFWWPLEEIVIPEKRLASLTAACTTDTATPCPSCGEPKGQHVDWCPRKWTIDERGIGQAETSQSG